MKAIILAGGKGSRLWPLSRDMYPKQLLSLDDNQSLLQKTFRRLLKFMNVGDIVTITNIRHYQDIKLQLNQINFDNIVISELIGKNTAPAIACGIQFFKQQCDDDIVLIMPSDHLINNVVEFEKSLNSAMELANQGYIVTFGIKPQYPETGYGYIKTKEALYPGFKVEKFVEKPDSETALQYVQSGDYYWNGGIFMGKISAFLEEFYKYTPEIFLQLPLLNFSERNAIPYEIYENMPSISIDYAVMEKSDKIALVELLSDWNDLGSWKSLYQVRKKDNDNNVLKGNVIVNNVKNSLIFSQKELVAVSDLEDIVLVETEDAIMACKMSESQNVKVLYEKLIGRESDITKFHKTIYRPWGYYTCLNSGKGYLTKNICVLPGQKLSLQSHKYRSEHWVVLEGKAFVILDGREFIIEAGGSIDIPINSIHSLQNPYDEELKVLEVQRGSYLSEDDIVRYSDCYGRV